MSRWNTAFENQKLMQKIQTIIGLVESIDISSQSEQDMAEYSRFLKVIKLFDTRVSKSDPELFAIDRWGKFSTALTEVQNHIQSFASSKDIVHLQNANGVLDKTMNALQLFDNTLTVEEFKSIADSAAIFQKKVAEELNSIQAKREEIKAQLNSLSTAIKQNSERLNANDQVIQQQKVRLDQSITEFQQQFSVAQESRNKDFLELMQQKSKDISAQQENFNTEFHNICSKLRADSDTALKELNDKSNDHLKFLQTREAEVNEIFGAIGTTAFAGNFKTTADNEARSANWLRIIALCLMFCMVLVAGFAFYISITHEPDRKVFGFRLATILVLGIPAFYAANESAKHRERERQARKVHLELASLDAYLVLLPEQERHKIKGDLTGKFFGLPFVTEKGDDVSQKDLFGVISTVINNLTKGK